MTRRLANHSAAPAKLRLQAPRVVAKFARAQALRSRPEPGRSGRSVLFAFGPLFVVEPLFETKPVFAGESLFASESWAISLCVASRTSAAPLPQDRPILAILGTVWKSASPARTHTPVDIFSRPFARSP